MNLNAQNCRGHTSMQQMLFIPSVAEEMKDQVFNAVAIVDHEGRSALSYAVEYRNLKAVKSLLRRGADVNSKCAVGITPLFEAFRVKIRGDNEDEVLKIVETLLQYGADTQHVSDYGKTVLDFAVQTQNFTLLKPIVAHIAMLKYTGTRIENIIWTQINEYSKVREQFTRYDERIGRMMTCRVYGSITLFDLLTEPEAKMTRYFRNSALASRLRSLDIHCHSNTYYFRLLNRRIANATIRAKLQKRAGLVIAKITMLHDVVVQKIIDYLDKKSLVQLCKL